MNNLEVKATVLGQPLESMPQDLYIPPDALEIFLETFTGPLDLLLYLIKKQNVDILDIPVAEITRQYTQYIELMQDAKLELAAEYMLMAGMLAEIKSRMLLPRPSTENDEEDPRAELIRRLQEYERFKKAAEKIDDLPRLNKEIFSAKVAATGLQDIKHLPTVLLKDLCLALSNVLSRAKMYSSHQIKKEVLSTRERMAKILTALQSIKFANFSDLFELKEGRPGVIVTFSAILELLKQNIIEIVQTEIYGSIHVKKMS